MARFRLARSRTQFSVRLHDEGYFALDTAADEIAELVRGFAGSSRLGHTALDESTLRAPAADL